MKLTDIVLKHVHHSLTIDMKVALMLSGKASVFSNGVQTFQTNTSVRRAWRDGDENSSSGSTMHSSSSERRYRYAVCVCVCVCGCVGGCVHACVVGLTTLD